MNGFVMKCIVLLFVNLYLGTSNEIRNGKLLNLFGNILTSETIAENTLLGTYQVVEGALNLTRCITNEGQTGLCTGSLVDCGKIGGTVKGVCSTLKKCCVVESGCDGFTQMNNTYFIGPGSLNTTPGVCSYTIQRQKSEEICQLRLDFELFVLAPPVSGENFDESRDGYCLNDLFEVSGGTNKLTMLCGTNTGKHMYVHIARQQKATIRLTVKSLGSFASRAWRIRVTQIPCNADYKAPEHCTEYYTGPAGMITSPNHIRGRGDNQELVNSFQRICIRRENGFCGICYTQCSPQDTTTFSTSNQPSISMTCPNDFLLIPCGQTSYEPFTSTITCFNSMFCGQNNFKTICSPFPPFELLYRTNAIEGRNENSQGFCLHYQQQTCQGRTV